MQIGGKATILDFDPFNTRTNPESSQGLGQPVYLGDQRIFRHGKAGAGTVSPGKLQTAPVQKTNHHSCTAIASAIGTTTPTFTLGATAAVAGEYDEGFVTINVTPDVGRTYKISYMGATSSAGTATPTLFEGIQAAWTTATRVSLVHNVYNGVIDSTTAATIRPAGVSLVSILTGDYGWLQTRGVASVLSQGTTSLGGSLIAGSDAGSVTDLTDFTAPNIQIIVGYSSIMVGATTEYRPIFLTID